MSNFPTGPFGCPDLEEGRLGGQGEALVTGHRGFVSKVAVRRAGHTSDPVDVLKQQLREAFYPRARARGARGVRVEWFLGSWFFAASWVLLRARGWVKTWRLGALLTAAKENINWRTLMKAFCWGVRLSNGGYGMSIQSVIYS